MGLRLEGNFNLQQNSTFESAAPLCTDPEGNAQRGVINITTTLVRDRESLAAERLMEWRIQGEHPLRQAAA